MNGPGPRAGLRSFESALWGAITYILIHWGGIDTAGLAVFSTLYLATCGLGEAAYDWQRARP